MKRNAAASDSINYSIQLLSDKESRARLVRATADFVKGTPLDPQPYEKTLLQLFVEGELTIDEVVQRLEEIP
jgi:hypothetical protein